MWSSNRKAQRNNIAPLSTTITNSHESGRASSWFYQPLSSNPTNEPSVNTNNSTTTTTTTTAAAILNNNDIDGNENLSRWDSWSSFLPFMGQRETQVKQPWWCPNIKLSTTQKLVCFVVLLGSGLSCFLISSMYIPLLLFKARKFCIFFTMGSLLVMTSFAFLFGPMSHLQHLFSKDRLPFTLAYVGSLLGTLFVSMHLQSTILTIIFVIIQIFSLIWYFMSYLPHGHTSMKFVATMLTRSVSSTLPL